jgi:signal transduction protein with GAF and PtsI domain
MVDTLAQRLLDGARQEMARTLTALCGDVGAAESSILLPRGEDGLFFFASSNPALMQPEVPIVPISTSFSGLAFRSGQTIAFADAATQAPHFKAVDELVGQQTHEFAAVPISDRATLGIITLVNRSESQTGGSRPFDLTELRRAEAVAREMANPIALLAGLLGVAFSKQDSRDALDADLLAELALLNESEQRVMHSLASALIHNRAE